MYWTTNYIFFTIINGGRLLKFWILNKYFSAPLLFQDNFLKLTSSAITVFYLTYVPWILQEKGLKFQIYDLDKNLNFCKPFVFRNNL